MCVCDSKIKFHNDTTMIIRKALQNVANNALNGNKLQQELLKSYLRKTSNQFIYLNNEKLARKFCETIQHELQDVQDEGYLYEASPGQGVLSEQLLKHCDGGRLRVFEHVPKRRLHLEQQLKPKFDDRLEIVDKQILDFTTGNYRLLDIHRDDLIEICFGGLKNNWSTVVANDDNADDGGGQQSDNHKQPAQPSFRFFAALSPFLARDFLTYLVYSLVRFETFFETGPNEFFVFVPVSQLRTIVSRPSKNLNLYTAFTIHMNSLFDYDVIDLYTPELKTGVEKVKIEGQIYSVISGTNFDFTNDRKFKSKESFVLMKFKPKSFVNQVEGDFLIDYVYFVKQSFMKRTNNAIKYYEKLFPGCTIDLIGLGVSYFKTMGDLTSQEMFQIFKHLSKLPHYTNSIFKQEH